MRRHQPSDPMASRGRTSRLSSREATAASEAILTAMEALLETQHFDDLTVADVLAEAQVSRATFYAYYESKYAVLAELVQRAVNDGLDAARPWLTQAADPIHALRAGITDGAHLWQRHAGVLRAIVDTWRTDPQLTTLWSEQMGRFTDATITQLQNDERAQQRLAGVDLTVVANMLTWAGERIYYLAACGMPPFDDEQAVVEALMHLWTSTLYTTDIDQCDPP